MSSGDEIPEFSNHITIIWLAMLGSFSAVFTLRFAIVADPTAWMLWEMCEIITSVWSVTLWNRRPLSHVGWRLDFDLCRFWLRVASRNSVSGGRDTRYVECHLTYNFDIILDEVWWLRTFLDVRKTTYPAQPTH